MQDDKHTEQARKKVSNSLHYRRGRLARRWAGEQAGYTAIHKWVHRTYGKATKCDNLTCPRLPARFEWAVISGDCTRDINNFVELCLRCHRKYDNGNLEIVTSKGTFKREWSVTCPNCNHAIVL